MAPLSADHSFSSVLAPMEDHHLGTTKPQRIAALCAAVASVMLVAAVQFAADSTRVNSYAAIVMVRGSWNHCLGLVFGYRFCCDVAHTNVLPLVTDLRRGGSARVLDVCVAVHDCQQPEV